MTDQYVSDEVLHRFVKILTPGGKAMAREILERRSDMRECPSCRLRVLKAALDGIEKS